MKFIPSKSFYNINSIFLSLQGEGVEQGNPTIFIRTAGCNLNCSYCDSQYAANKKYENYHSELMTCNEIIKEVQNFLPYYYICITGGEPLLQKNMPLLVDCLLRLKKTIWIETNGTQSIKPYINNINNERCRIVMDIKCPSSNYHDKTNWSNLRELRSVDQVKFVIQTEEDYKYAKIVSHILSFLSPVQILFSPALLSRNQEEVNFFLTPDKLAKKIVEDKLFIRYSLQIHKKIWGPERKDV